ncbi:hypothetical protein [Haloarchaeobius amylolyticus]|uniref:hypothetical protein n=1 Tax=Haloarchaeobius amylolyticus TaxID=1198296 RepID=UPI0022717549|nr:hypothetical protein [Haloarchaeobius amylolyticus]
MASRLLTTYFRRSWPHVSGDRLLYAFPLLASLLYVDRLRRLLTTNDVLSLRFGLPTGLGSISAFVNVPVTEGITVSPLFFLTPVALAADAALTAAYLGRMRGQLHGREVDPVAAAREHLVPMLGVVVFTYVTGVGLLVAGLALGGLGLLAVPLVLLFGYLFYAAPYLVVVEGRGAIAALGRSYDLGTDGGEYLSFAVQYLLFTAAVSFPLSLVVYNIGIVGVALGILLTAPLAVAANAATMLFVEELVGAEGGDRESPSAHWLDPEQR